MGRAGARDEAAANPKGWNTMAAVALTGRGALLIALIALMRPSQTTRGLFSALADEVS